MKKVLVSLVCTFSLFACADAASEDCPARADECAAHCVTATALRYDAARACREKSILGCQGPAEGADDDAPCMKANDGVLWIGSRALFDSTFVECTEAERNTIGNGPAGCP